MQNAQKFDEKIKIHSSWKAPLSSQFEQGYMQELKSFLLSEYKQGKTIYPKGTQYFAAFDFCPFDKVKVVILGQDPYHGAGQAHGLCFSVPPGVRVPPSLINIFKELKSDLQIEPPKHGCLENWAKQGVLLLNAVLTVEMAKAGSHRNRGWEKFTDSIITTLNEQHRHLVFILWGAYAQAKKSMIDQKKHLILESVHPSPLSAHRGFFGSKPFSKANAFLVKHGLDPIQWSNF